jgi:tRNA dimethylallyltransferase
VAERFGASILSVDSMQVFRGMDIGTAKPDRVTRERIPHHMLDVADPAEEFSVKEFQSLGRAVLETTARSQERMLIVGGSGLHFRSLVDPMTFAPTDTDIRKELEAMDPAELQRSLLSIDADAGRVLDVRNLRRVVRAIEVWRITSETPSYRAGTAEANAVRTYRPFLEHVSFGMDPGGDSLDRIERRFSAMLANGLLDEVSRLAPALGRTAAQALGYKELISVVDEKEDIDVASRNAIRATKALVKRQRTFFRRDPRIEWIPWQDDSDLEIGTIVNRIGEGAGWTS